MANHSNDTTRSNSRHFTIRRRPLVWIVATVAALIVAVAAIDATAEQRHQAALAQLVADGAVVGSPTYGTGITIRLTGEQFTDGHFRYLRDLRRVRELRILDAPQITDVGFTTIGRRTDIELLALIRTGVTPASLTQISEWRTLTCLAIPGMRVQKSDLSRLEKLTNLILLFLDETPITDADVQELHKLPSLLWLSIQGTQTTDAGVTELRKALPVTRVVR